MAATKSRTAKGLGENQAYVRNPAETINLPYVKGGNSTMAKASGAKAKPNGKSRAATGGGKKRSSSRASQAGPKASGRRGSSRGRARRNPPPQAISALGLIVGAAGMAAFDIGAAKVLGQQSEPISAAIKLGGGYLIATEGNRLPYIGKYSTLIGGGLALVGAYSLFKQFALPYINQLSGGRLGIPEGLGEYAYLPGVDLDQYVPLQSPVASAAETYS